MEILDKLAPLKRKYIRANHPKSVTKEVSKSYHVEIKIKKSVPKNQNSCV